MVGITIILVDLAIERGDYSLVNRDPLKEFSTPWQLSDGEEEEGQSKKNQIITLPYTLEAIRVGQPITLSNVLPEVLGEDSYVFLRARHQFIQAYIDGKLVYSYGTKDQRLFGESPASA